jgi:hypothetical protein
MKMKAVELIIVNILRKVNQLIVNRSSRINKDLPVIYLTINKD